MAAAKVSQFLRGCLFTGTFATFVGVYLSISLLGAGIILTLLSGGILLAKEPSFSKCHPLLYPSLLLSFFIGLSILFAKPYSFGKPLEKLFYLFGLFPFTFCFSYFPRAKNTLLKLAWMLSVFLGTLGVAQCLGLVESAPSFLNKHLKPLPESEGLFLATGFTFHHTPFGASLTWLFHLCLAHALLGFQKKFRSLYFLGAFLSLIGAFSSLSRGVWLSLSLSTFFVLVLVSWKKTLLAGVLALFCFFLILPRFPALKNRVHSISFNSNGERLELWKISWEMFKDSPLWGQGYHSFGERLHQFRRAGTLYPGCLVSSLTSQSGALAGLRSCGERPCSHW